MTARPRLLMLTVDYAPQTGGVPHLLRSIVETTSELVDWRVVTAARGDETPGVIRSNGVRGLPLEAWRQRSWLRGADTSMIISAHVYLGPLAHLIGAVERKPVSSLTYGRELAADRIHQRLALLTLKRDHKTITISRNSEQLLHALGVDPQRSGWVGTELTPGFPPIPAPSRPSRARRGLNLVAVTRLAEGYKNLEVTLRAVRVLAESGLVESYTIVGEGPRRGPLEARVEQLGLCDIVSLPGRLSDDDLAELLANSHLGLFPSRNSVAEGGFEGFGIVLQELAAAGMPVVVGDAAGARDAWRPEWSTAVDPDDVRQWVEAIAEYAGDDARLHDEATAAHAFGATLDSAETARRYVEQLLGEMV